MCKDLVLVGHSRDKEERGDDRETARDKMQGECVRTDRVEIKVGHNRDIQEMVKGKSFSPPTFHDTVTPWA